MKNMDKNAGEGGQQNDGKGGVSSSGSGGNSGKSSGNSGTGGSGAAHDPAALLDAASLFGMYICELFKKYI